MYAVLSSLKSILKSSETQTDDWIFKLHSKLTFMMEIAFSIIVTTNQFFGDPINCLPAFKDEIPEKVINNYCWIHSTFTLPGAYDKVTGVQVPHPGIDKYTPNEPRVYHAYYQWVCFFLFLQGTTFYLSRYLWKTKEGGKLGKVILGLHSPIMGSEEDVKDDNSVDHDEEKSPMVNDSVHQYGIKNQRIKRLAQYLKDSLGRHGLYAYIYFLCEILNFVNVVCQIFITNAFLGGEFTTYGVEVIQFAMTDQINRTDPMIKIFPRVTKCTFHRFGASGDVQRNDALCVLPINIINEKIFIFLWFWFVALAILSGLQLLLRFPIVFSNGIRWKVLSLNTTEDTKGALRAIGSSTSNLSDWYVIALLRKNLNPMNFEALVKNLEQLLPKAA